MHNGPPQRPQPEKRKNFLTRFTYETFQKKIPYTEDLYENKQDMIRDDYVKRRSLIVEPERPYTTTVKQRGTFYSEKLTYGEDREFPNKPKQQRRPPSYGPFKPGDLAHTGFNKTIGKNPPYVEDPENDPI